MCNSTDTPARLRARYITLLFSASLIVSSPPWISKTGAVSFGTLSLVLEPGASAYEELMRGAAAVGLFTALDPNIRAGLITDPDAYRARFKSWLPSVTLLKLSEEDALWLGGTPREWLASGPSAVVITHGGDGLSAFTPDGTVYAVPGEEVAVVDTIGAGDSFMGGLLRHLLASGLAARLRAGGEVERAELVAAAQFALRVAAVTVARRGADPPRLADLDL